MSLKACTVSFIVQSYEMLLKRLAKKMKPDADGKQPEFTKQMLEETIDEIIQEIHR